MVCLEDITVGIFFVAGFGQSETVQEQPAPAPALKEYINNEMQIILQRRGINENNRKRKCTAQTGKQFSY